MPGSISGYDKNIYHLLCCAFGQCIAISEVVHFNIFNIVSIRNIHVSIYIARARPRHSGRGDFAYRACGLWRVKVRKPQILGSLGAQRYLLYESVEHRYAECPSLPVLKHWFGPPQPLHQNISPNCWLFGCDSIFLTSCCSWINGRAPLLFIGSRSWLWGQRTSTSLSCVYVSAYRRTWIAIKAGWAPNVRFSLVESGTFRSSPLFISHLKKHWILK